MVGEVVTTSSAITTTFTTTSDTDVNFASLTLTPGRWRLYYSCFVYIETGIASGNSHEAVLRIKEGTNEVANSSTAVFARNNTSTSLVVGNTVSSEVIVDITESKTYRLVTYFENLSGTALGGGIVVDTRRTAKFYAERLA
jgi:hypothetical protein